MASQAVGNSGLYSFGLGTISFDSGGPAKETAACDTSARKVKAVTFFYRDGFLSEVIQNDLPRYPPVLDTEAGQA